MSESTQEILQALKTAFCYMPRAIEVTRYEYGERTEKVLADIQRVREALLAQGVDPEEVYGEMDAGAGPSCL